MSDVVQFKVKPNCDDCPHRCKPVQGHGPIDADIVIVGEGPGVEEVKAGRPFVGTSGKLLWAQIPEELHDKIYVTNAHMCRPTKKKDPSMMAKATKACRNRLLAEINGYPRKLIITLGNSASHAVTGNYGIKITQDRGIIMPHKGSEEGIFPIVHPAALLRGTGSFPQFKKDLKNAVALAYGTPLEEAIEPYTAVVTQDTLEMVVDYIIAFWETAGDFETGGLNKQRDEILCLMVCGEAHQALAIPDDLLYDPQNHELLTRMLDGTKWIWHNGKFDIEFLKREELPGRVDHDTMMLSYSLNEGKGHGLEVVARDVIGGQDWKHMLAKYLPNKNTSYRVIPRPVLYKYGGKDVSYTLQIFQKLYPVVCKDKNLNKLYHNILIPASNFLQEVEARGMLIDWEYQATLKDPKDPESLYNQVEGLNGAISEGAGYSINPNSPKQLGKLLFEDLGFKVIKKTAKGASSTDAEVLERLPDHPIVRAIRKYRKVQKQYSTYVIGPEKWRDHLLNTVHTTFKIHGTRTGRLSSSEPNIQNIPRDPRIKNMYIPRPGYGFLEVDLNQAELRSLAQLSGCPDLLAIYNDPNHPGLHHEMSVFLFGEDYDGEDKMAAKAVNFGIVYGREARSLAEEFDVPLPEAQRWIDGWFKRFPGAAKFIKKCRQAATDGNTMTTIFGRKKRHHLVTRENLKSLQNQAANFPHQSIASDITLIAGIRVHPKLKKHDCHIVNLVHDSLIIEYPLEGNTLQWAARTAIDEMESVPLEIGFKRLPFTADAKSSTESWGKLQKLEVAA